VEFKRDAGAGLCTGTFETRSEDFLETEYPLRYSRGIIEDFVVLPKVKHRFRRRNVFGNLPMAVKPVHHVKVALSKFKDADDATIAQQGDTTFVQGNDFTDLLCLHERTLTQTCPPLAFLCRRFGSEWVRTNVLDQLPQYTTGIQFAEVEWSALADQFNEGCESLIPSNFFAGEAFAEGGIYLDAIRLVTNPTKAIVGFIKNVRQRGLHRMSLGAIDLYYKHLFSKKSFVATREALDTAHDIGLIKFGLREGINQHLSYKFGVVPAIHDVRSTIDSHSAVEARLLYLNSHRGQYVPIRVKKGFPATFSPGTFSSPYLDFGSVLKKAFTVAHIFGQGRIRTDINEASRWRAYAEYFGLNKVVGTAWELIPFSFVADWFTNSQEAINNLTRIPLGESPFLNMTSIGHSWKNLAVYDYVINSGYDQTNGYSRMEPNSQFPCFSYAITDYTRLPGFPDTSWFANPSNLGLFQAVTGGELLLQKAL
jgi:hypothetical protein